MKRIGTILMSSFLLLGLSQCKKEQTNAPETDEGVYITVDVNGGSKGLRVDVDPNAPGGYATVKFEENDKLYVGNNGYYRGYLKYQNGKFCGRLTVSSGDYLHFYFVGGCTPVGISTSQLVAPNKTSFSVNITDQTGQYPVIAYGHSTNMYSEETASYSATLDNYCSIMKVPIEGAGTANTVTLRGMKNVVTVSLTVNNGDATGNPFSFSSSPEGYGEIMLHDGDTDNEKWAVVLPQDAVLAQLFCDGFKNVFVSVPEITADRYYDDDIDDITLVPGTTTSDFPFSVAANTQVYFSPGNLQAVFANANTSSCTWRFADHQYDYIGDAVANTVVGNNCVTTAGTVDLFAWVGASSIYVAAYGINNLFKHTEYGYYDNEALKKDWGEAAASLGGYNTWRTLSIDEWEYLFNTRSTNTTINGIDNARYTQATINTDGTPVKGIILFPDDGYWGPTTNATGITFGTINGPSEWSTQCTTSGWISLEYAGCVFLPAAGYRSLWYHTNSSNYSPHDPSTWGADCYVNSANILGFYWSSTPYQGGEGAYAWARGMEFESSSVGFATGIINGVRSRGEGGAVRLVRPAD